VVESHAGSVSICTGKVRYTILKFDTMRHLQLESSSQKDKYIFIIKYDIS